ncbi:IS982 family transposase [Tessaracoccus caeni]|uniref:IS982 family transposase n=1 Tax=Tessaracoccus caeni TaxID=3031239 RepID=UPI0023DA43DF|nr:IS982 family transposase [Tessaracoccus caeni]MDF1490417.1 IS982 family transposase [Tessaracoccus caeni]
MVTDLDTLATALYVTCDDLLKAHPERRPPRPRIGLQPRITDAEIITLAVMGSLLGYTSERHWIRYARTHFLGMFPALPGQSGYGKRLRKLADTMAWLISVLAADTSIITDDVWIVDSTPVECARSRETVQRSDLAGWAEYGYCASHSRYFWGLRLHLVCTLHGLPVGWALTGAKADEREVLADLLASIPPLEGLQHDRQRRQIVIGDKNYYGKTFETEIAASGIELLRPTRKGEPPRPGERFFKPLRQVIESVNDTLKGQLNLEHHGGRTITGVCARIAAKILALTTAIWHNDHIGAAIRRSLIAYDH